jgi:hypothetical protein
MSKKRTTWVLDTETKGTGAEMVPLERLQERKRLKDGRERIRVIARDEPAQEKDPTTGHEVPRAPRRFRVVNVLSRQVLADDAGISEVLDALRSVGSVVDVNVYVREADEEDWRPLTISERRTLWSYRDAA